MLLFTSQAAGGSVSLFFFVSHPTAPTSYAKPSRNSLLQICAQNSPHFLNSCCYSLVPKRFWGLEASSRLLNDYSKVADYWVCWSEVFLPSSLCPLLVIPLSSQASLSIIKSQKKPLHYENSQLSLSPSRSLTLQMRLRFWKAKQTIKHTNKTVDFGPLWMVPKKAKRGKEWVLGVYLCAFWPVLYLP